MKKNENEIEKDNKKTFKNYIILIILFLTCMGLVLYLCKIYKINDEENKKIPVIKGDLQEIYVNDLEHYIMDNPSTVIYMCVANDDNCRLFERSFKKLLRHDDYSKEIIYLNLTDYNQEDFISWFNNKYPYKTKVTESYPAFVIFEDGEIVGVLQGKENKPLTISKAKQFLELNEIGEGE